MGLTAQILKPVLEEQPELLAEALAAVHADQPMQADFEALRSMGHESGSMDLVAGLIVNWLKGAGTEDRLLAYLRAHGFDPMPVPPTDLVDAFFDRDFGGTALGPLTRDDFDLSQLAEFSARALAFRCRIRVDGEIRGSGAFVSPRLILTAAHVLGEAPYPDTAPRPTRIEIVASDGHTYPVRDIWQLPFHPSEPSGQLPPPCAAETHADVALLRADKPLGRLFGQIDLPEPPPDWTGTGRIALIHFPSRQERGLAIGRLRRDGPDDTRQFHNIDTAPGSSGGPGFDDRLRFLGLHQGRWQAFRRLVPYARFARNPGFQDCLQADRAPTSLWSLNGALDGHMIIGRGKYFKALVCMMEGSAPNLRGVWIKRLDTSRTEGLGFSYYILRAFLEAREHDHDSLRLSTEIDTEDLIAHLHAQVFGPDGSTEALPGLRRDETSAGAHDQDRARTLAEQLEIRARTRKRPLWIYFENPPHGLMGAAQVQLEHIVRAMLVHPHLYPILAGFETYNLVSQHFAQPDAARNATAPGVMIEYLGHFGRSDVAACVKDMVEALRLDWEAQTQAHMVSRALRHAQPIAHDTYDIQDLHAVAKVLQAEAQRDLGAP